ncbi:MAG: fibronectin type III domain-containing protein [Candidatus Muirbacterium halophilum]|nr:fibronectin type III domain-containing protein [Candidatus Muirbacterium halophilum]MCK9476983.1 fibronectin type III domain-containing protein [Candidatus Muirbacterium halophilum]
MTKKNVFLLSVFVLALLIIIGCGDKDSGISGYAMYDDGESPNIPQGLQVSSVYLYSSPTLTGANEKRFKIILRWNKVSSNINGEPKDNIIGYKIFRNTKDKPIGIVDKDSLIFEDNDTTIKEGKNYSYFVVAFDSLLRETFSDAQSIRVSATTSAGHMPDRPLKVVLIRESNNSITMVWDKPENISELAEANDPIDSYMIYRKIGESGGYDIVAKVPASTFFFNDPTVAEGSRYYYKVRAVTSSGLLGLESEDKSIVISYDYNDNGYAPGAPQIQSVIIPNDISPNSRKVTWGAPTFDDNGKSGADSAGDVQGYKIYRSSKYNDALYPFTQIAIVQNSTSWIDENITDNNNNIVDYFYKVAAYDYSGNTGDRSQPLKAGMSSIPSVSGFAGTLDSFDQINLSWFKANGYGYTIFESKNGTTFRELIYLSEATINSSYLTGGTVNYSPRKIMDDDTYYYKVAAVQEGTGYQGNRSYFVKFSKYTGTGGTQAKVILEAETLVTSVQVRGITDATANWMSGWGQLANGYYALSSSAKTVGTLNYQVLYFNPRGSINENPENYPYDYWWNNDGTAVYNAATPSGIGINTQYRYQDQFRLLFMPQTTGKYNINIYIVGDNNVGKYMILPRTDTFVLGGEIHQDFYSSSPTLNDDIFWTNVLMNAYEPVYIVFSAYQEHNSLGNNHAIYVDRIEIERVD